MLKEASPILTDVYDEVGESSVFQTELVPV